MSLAIEPTLGLPEVDRRREAVEPRRSWASPQPAELRGTEFNDSSATEQRWRRVAGTYSRRTIALDATVAILVSSIALSLTGYTWRQVVVLSVLGAIALVTLTAANQGYEPRRMGDGPEEYRAVLRAGVALAGVLMAVSYTVVGLHIPRGIVFVAVPVLMALSLAVRYTHRRFLHRARSRGSAMSSTLLVGAPDDIERVADVLRDSRHHGYEMTAACVPSLDGSSHLAGMPIAGGVADVAQVVADWAIDVVIVAGPALSPEALRRLSWALDRVGAQLVVVPGLVEVTGPRITVRPTAGLSLLELEVGAPRHRLFGKALLDRVAGAALLVLAAPVIGLSAAAVRLTSPGPAFYRQTRLGVDGAPFTMWKLRSMYVDADRRKAELLAQNEGSGVLFKVRDDPRVTVVGRFLRRYSLDELPQLFNVVRGDMSLVGPRPPLGEEVARYEDAAHRRLRVRPGLTGLWQVSGRSDLSWEESVRLDLRYVDNWSVAMDLTILWKTARAVIRSEGAY